MGAVVTQGLVASGKGCEGRRAPRGQGRRRLRPDAEPDLGETILLTESATATAVVPLLDRVRGLICTSGGITSHLAIVSREFGLSCIMGAELADPCRPRRRASDRWPRTEPSAVPRKPTGPSQPQRSQHGPHRRLHCPRPASACSAPSSSRSASAGTRSPCSRRDGEEAFVSVFRDGPRDGRARVPSAPCHVSGARPQVERVPRPRRRRPLRAGRGEPDARPPRRVPLHVATGGVRARATRDPRRPRQRTRQRPSDGPVRPDARRPAGGEEKRSRTQGCATGTGSSCGRWRRFPSTALLAERFAAEVDGISIGSNDLTQLVLGADRDSAELSTAIRRHGRGGACRDRPDRGGAHAAGVAGLHLRRRAVARSRASCARSSSSGSTRSPSSRTPSTRRSPRSTPRFARVRPHDASTSTTSTS